MIYPATKDITVLRNVPWVYAIEFRGVDFTNMSFAFQVRLYRGAAGDPLIDLSMAAVGSEGISLDVDLSGDLPVSTLTLNIPESTLDGVTPPAGTKAGTDPVLYYDLKSTDADGAFIQSRWLEGKFTIHEGITV